MVSSATVYTVIVLVLRLNKRGANDLCYVTVSSNSNQRNLENFGEPVFHTRPLFC